jgi:hypothetical protein
VHLIDASEVAAWLSLSRRKVIAMARGGVMPCYALPCGEFIFAEQEIKDWLLSQKRGANPDEASRPIESAQSQESEAADVG